jgi:hypothetical protein
MARDRIDLTSFVGKLLKEDDADILRDGVQVRSDADGYVGQLQDRRPLTSGPRAGPPTVTATALGPGTRASARSSSGSPRLPSGPTSRRCSILVGVHKRRCSRSSSRPTSRESRPARSTISFVPSASTASPSQRSRGSAVARRRR